jgi:hypothetical protein
MGEAPGTKDDEGVVGRWLRKKKKPGKHELHTWDWPFLSPLQEQRTAIAAFLLSGGDVNF